jgi:hypothetical protein
VNHLDSDELANLVDAVMLLTAGEGLLLWVWRRLSGRGLLMRDYGFSLLSGLLLMGALRCALSGSPVVWSWACLAGSGLCHALDLGLRWRTRAQQDRAVQS